MMTINLPADIKFIVNGQSKTVRLEADLLGRILVKAPGTRETVIRVDPETGDLECAGAVTPGVIFP